MTLGHETKVLYGTYRNSGTEAALDLVGMIESTSQTGTYVNSFIDNEPNGRRYNAILVYNE